MATKWKIKAHETGKSCGNNSGKNAKVYVPALMPMVKFGKPKKKPKQIKKSCFANAKKCKPRMGKRVQTQNYMTIPCTENAKKNNFKHGAKLDIDVRNSDIDKIVVSGKKLT